MYSEDAVETSMSVKTGKLGTFNFWPDFKPPKVLIRRVATGRQLLLMSEGVDIGLGRLFVNE